MTEEYLPGYKRRVYTPRPGVFSLAISHRISTKELDLWSDWVWWGNGECEQEVIERHNKMLLR